MNGLDRLVPARHHGWLMVAASCVMMGLSFGSLIAVTVFIRPLEAEFGWERGVTSFAYSSASFMTGLLGIPMGRLVDRISPRPIVLTGAVMIGAAYVLLSRIDQVWQLYLLYGLMVGGLGNGCFMIPLLSNVGFWFDKHKGVAIGAVMAGQSLGGALTPYLARYLLAQMDWRAAYLTLGLLIWGALVPLAWIVREPPGLARLKEAAEQQPLAAGAVLSPMRLTVVLCIAIVMCCICMAIPVVHLYPLAVEAGLPAVGASLVLGVMMGVSIIGRVGIGKVADHTGGIRALLLASGLQTVMIFWFTQVDTLPALLLFAMLFGLGYGGVVPSYAIIMREMLPVHTMGFSMGLVFFFGNLGMATGGYLGGFFYDLSGGYAASYAVGALAGVINLLIVGSLLLYARQQQQPLPQPA